MMDVPAETPSTSPPEVIVATGRLVLVHVPPVGVPISVVVDPAHKVYVPVTSDGAALTVTVAVVIHAPTE